MTIAYSVLRRWSNGKRTDFWLALAVATGALSLPCHARRNAQHLRARTAKNATVFYAREAKRMRHKATPAPKWREQAIPVAKPAVAPAPVPPTVAPGAAAPLPTTQRMWNAAKSVLGLLMPKKALLTRKLLKNPELRTLYEKHAYAPAVAASRAAAALGTAQVGVGLAMLANGDGNGASLVGIGSATAVAGGLFSKVSGRQDALKRVYRAAAKNADKLGLSDVEKMTLHELLVN